MKKIIFFLFFAAICGTGMSQPGTWTWLRGDSAINSNGNFGVQGVTSATNDPPAFYEPAEFRDQQGNFWFFGGVHGISQYADLWKYEPAINQWTWMTGTGGQNYTGNFGSQGVPSPGNLPPALAYGAPTWVDLNGDFWIFGGFGPIGRMSDLWKYEVASNTWTWMHGTSLLNKPAVYGTQGVAAPANTPGMRFQCNTSWVDANNNLWLYGGYDGFLNYNDMWMYNTVSNEWTWMSGDSVGGMPANYGTLGIPAAANSPGGRQAYCHWTDSTGNFYFFGGRDSLSRSYNDLWKYDTGTNIWTWVSGTNAADDPGTFGSQCVPSVNNIPPSRYENRCFWTDSTGKFWMYGGYNITQVKKYGDLWVYDPATLAWAYIGGDSIPDDSATYGTMGVPAVNNKPGARWGGIGWYGGNGHLYLFGGRWNMGPEDRNDVWKFEMDPACPANPNPAPTAGFSVSDSAFCEKQCLDFTDLSVNNPTSWQWYFPGADSLTSNEQNPVGICYSSYGSFDVTLVACNANGCDSITFTNLITEYQSPPAPLITVNFDTLFSTPAFSYQWYNGSGIIPGATNQYYIYQQQGGYYVIITDSNGCASSSAVMGTGIEEVQAANHDMIVMPNPSDGHVKIILSERLNQLESCLITDVTGRVVSNLGKQKTGPVIDLDLSYLSDGVYLVRIISNGKSFKRRITVNHQL